MGSWPSPELQCSWKSQTTMTSQGRGADFFLVFNWGVWGAGRFSINYHFLLRVAYPILLIEVFVILTNKKDFIIVGELGFKRRG